MYKRTIVDPLQVVGTDPGSVNFGICHVKIHGFATKPHDITTYYPIISILDWELWNIKKQSIIRFDPTSSTKYKTIDYSKTSALFNNEDENDGIVIGGGGDINMTYLNASINNIILNSKWLFKPYTTPLLGDKQNLPILSTEIQCGHVKNDKFDIMLLSRFLPSSVHMVDLVKGDARKAAGVGSLASRRILHKLLKYGVSNEEYDGRKDDSIAVTRDLLALLDLQDALDFLKNLEQRKPKSQKVDDLTDAFLLAVQTAIDEWQKMKKQVFIIHKKQQEKKNRTPMMQITKECSSCGKTIVKDVKTDYKASNRKEKCQECKLSVVVVKKKKTMTTTTKKKTVTPPLPPSKTKTKDKQNSSTSKEKRKRKSKAIMLPDEGAPPPVASKKKRKRAEKTDNDEPVKKKQKKQKKQKKPASNEKEPSRITIDLTAIKPQFPKYHHDEDDISSRSPSFLEKEVDEISNSFDERVYKVLQKKKAIIKKLDFI